MGNAIEVLRLTIRKKVHFVHEVNNLANNIATLTENIEHFIKDEITITHLLEKLSHLLDQLMDLFKLPTDAANAELSKIQDQFSGINQEISHYASKDNTLQTLRNEFYNAINHMTDSKEHGVALGDTETMQLILLKEFFEYLDTQAGNPNFIPLDSRKYNGFVFSLEKIEEKLHPEKYLSGNKDPMVTYSDEAQLRQLINQFKPKQKPAMNYLQSTQDFEAKSFNDTFKSHRSPQVQTKLENQKKNLNEKLEKQKKQPVSIENKKSD